MSHAAVDDPVAPLREVCVAVYAVGGARTARLVEDTIRDGYGVASKL